ncbi:MAG: hypothetical protein EXX96DRAFT_478520 [Benjaminiella poitrasii]|nr:MAG: hypothetical protein EXX96DRAFT_478520 [Benjaminiella poitrasii]
MSFWWGQNAFDELVEKATSELLPAGQVDLALQFEISDQIRSKKVNAKDAMRSLKQRLNHKNPNVILTTLSLVDTCVKNSGPAFVKEVATREFMEELTHLLKARNGYNQDVKEKILYLIQVWGIASKGNSSLSYMSGTYNLLRAEGYSFPPVTEKIDPILLETAVAPDWTDSDCCERCRTTFTLTNRKHHCRQCGRTFCQQCSSKSLPLPHLGINDVVRVCDGCYIKVKLAKVAVKDTVSQLLGTPTTASISSSLTPNYTPSIKNNKTSSLNNTTNSNQGTTTENKFEDDIKKAIELSLKESERQQKRVSFYDDQLHSSSSETRKSDNKQKSQEEEEEANIAAAIAASLEDMKIQHQSQHDDLSSIEMENIRLFSTLMQNVHSSGKDVSRGSEINELYFQIGTLQPKLIKSLDEASRKHQLFSELHTKLNKAVRTYDKLLEDRLNNAQRISTRAPYSTFYNTNQLQYHPTIAYNQSFSPHPQPVIVQQPVQQPIMYPQQTQMIQTPVIQYQQPLSVSNTTTLPIQTYQQPPEAPSQRPPQQQQQQPVQHYQTIATNNPSLQYQYPNQQNGQTPIPQFAIPPQYQGSQQTYAAPTANNFYHNQHPVVDETPLIDL